jgi:hypothetical protein
MGTTTQHYAWPVPFMTDAPAGGSQIKTLGDAADATVYDIDARVTGRSYGVYRTEPADATGLVIGQWVTQPISTAIDDPQGWLQNRAITVPPGLYAIYGKLVVHLPANAAHAYAVTWFAKEGTTARTFGQSDVSATGSFDATTEMKTPLIYAPNAITLHPAGWNYTNQGDSLWFGSYIAVACLIDAASLNPAQAAALAAAFDTDNGWQPPAPSMDAVNVAAVRPTDA